MKRQKITAEELRNYITYDPITGFFFWLPREGGKASTKCWNSKFSGKRAGCTKTITGYETISVCNVRYLSHRLAWLYMTGNWPIKEIDHINGDRLDNRFCNLREATSSQNKINRPGRGAKSGYKGVYFHRHSGLWLSFVTRNKKQYSIGYFKTAEEAAVAYTNAITRMDGSFLHHSFKPPQN